MLLLRWLSPGLGHFGPTWHERLPWSCYGYGYAHVWSWARLGWTCPLLSSWSWIFFASLICLSRTVACQAHTSLRRQLWKSYRTMSPTITRYGGCISLWWTCGGHGSTILPGPGKLLTSFGSFGIVMTPVGWVHFGQMARNLLWGAVDLHMAMLWMAPSFRVIWCGRKETGSRMFSWILLQTDTLVLDQSVLSPIGHAALLWLLCTGISDLRP